MPESEVAIQESETERFVVDDLEGEVCRRLRPADLEGEVRRLIDPGQARETLHWGRNYLYVSRLMTPEGPINVVVKQFRNHGARARSRKRRKDSKAARSWRASFDLRQAGLRTPEPVMLIESIRDDGPSFFISREVEGFFESRYLFRALREGRREELFPQVDEHAFFTELGASIRRLHDAGIWHRDISIGNVLVRYPEAGEPGRPEIFFIDLNRARIGARLTLGRRVRDLCRLPVLKRAHRKAYLGAYWGEGAEGMVAKELYYRGCARLFLTQRLLKRLVLPIRRLGGALVPRRAHVHIPEAPSGLSTRDKIVWDHLSDQPHQHAGRFERVTVWVSDTSAHARAFLASYRAAPAICRRYFQLRRALYSEPVPFDGLGVAVRPHSAGTQPVIDLLDELGVRRVLLRLHPWQEKHDAEEELARELHMRGYELAFALPQNRDLVRDNQLWRASIERIAERFIPYGRHFQIGQAVNRSKWGIWHYWEYMDLAASAIEILRRAGDVEVLGPSVIDFEFYATAGLLNMTDKGVFFDAVSALLYVDRRGAPENRQMGFDTVNKIVLLRAIAETSRQSTERCWITEFNWPLREGPHSPAGRAVAVDEEAQADYLARFYLLSLGTGMVERAYWWQLIARGYGLAVATEDGGLRRRPAFRALATLARQLTGSTLEKPIEVGEEGRCYLFTAADGGKLAVAWSTGEPFSARLPGKVTAVTGRDGDGRDVENGGTEVRLTASPTYYRLKAREQTGPDHRGEIEIGKAAAGS